MSPMKRYAKKQAKTIKRRRLKARERIRQQRAEAQRYIEAIHPALEDFGLPDTLVAEVEGRLRAQQQLLGKIVGSCFPPSLGLDTLMNSLGSGDGIRMSRPNS